MMHDHRYAPLLLMLTQMGEDEEMLEALKMEMGDIKHHIRHLMIALESVCYVSYRNHT